MFDGFDDQAVRGTAGLFGECAKSGAQFGREGGWWWWRPLWISRSRVATNVTQVVSLELVGN